MSNMIKTIKYSKVSSGRNSNDVICDLAIDDGDHSMVWISIIY